MAERTDELSVRLAEYLDSHRFGKYRGLVEEVGRGSELGLVRARVPEVFGGAGVSPWARPAVPFAGKAHGFVALPELGDGVWIEFEAGDTSKPIWSGFWWGRDEIPEPGAEKTRVFATSEGHRLVLDDAAGEVRLEHGKGASITLTDREISLQVGTKKVVVTKTSVEINDGAVEVT